MSDDGSAPAPRPLENLISEAREGRLSVRMDLEKFIYLDRDCEFFKDKILNIQRTMTQISQQEAWGLGEHFAPNGTHDLVSGKTMVKRWREKSRGSANGVYEVMESHRLVIEDFQELFRTVREQMLAADSEQAARYRELEATLPQRQPEPQKWFGPGISFTRTQTK